MISTDLHKLGANQGKLKVCSLSTPQGKHLMLIEQLLKEWATELAGLILIDKDKGS